MYIVSLLHLVVRIPDLPSFFKLMFANNSKSLILQMAVINSSDSMGLYLINGEKLSINLVQFNGKDVTLTPNF